MRRGQDHYAGITSLNLAQCLVGSITRMRLSGGHLDAEQLLGRSSRGYESVSVRLAQAEAYAHLGRWDDAMGALQLALDSKHPEGEYEAVLDAASLVAWFGPHDAAVQILAKVDRSRLPKSWGLHWRVLDLWLVDRPGIEGALAELPPEPTPSFEVAAGFRWWLAVARAQYVLRDVPALDRAFERLDAIANAQRSPVQRRLVEVLRALRAGPRQLSHLLAAWPAHRDPLVGVFATEIIGQTAQLSEPAFASLMRVAIAFPHRWRDPVREAMATDSGSGLERVGRLYSTRSVSADDVSVLRDVSRRLKKSGHLWGDKLVERLAPHVVINDLGPISMVVGSRRIEGHEIRKKVLAVLAFLACQPGGSATPDQILEALWPELQPDQGINSVHQTIYFLRRVIEPDYRAGRSADYLHFDDDIVTFDRTLVDCVSWRCRRLIDARPETQRSVERCSDEYRGPFRERLRHTRIGPPPTETASTRRT